MTRPAAVRRSDISTHVTQGAGRCGSPLPRGCAAALRGCAIVALPVLAVWLLTQAVAG